MLGRGGGALPHTYPSWGGGVVGGRGWWGEGVVGGCSTAYVIITMNLGADVLKLI